MTCQTDLVPRRRSTFAPQCGLGERAWQRSGQGIAGTTMHARHTPALQARNDHKLFYPQTFSPQLCSLAGSISPGCKTAHLPVWQLFPPLKGKACQAGITRQRWNGPQESISRAHHGFNALGMRRSHESRRLDWQGHHVAEGRFYAWRRVCRPVSLV
jgi:hypothetical protein